MLIIFMNNDITRNLLISFRDISVNMDGLFAGIA